LSILFNFFISQLYDVHLISYNTCIYVLESKIFIKKILLSVFGNVIKPTNIAAKAVKIMSKSKDIGESGAD